MQSDQMIKQWNNGIILTHVLSSFTDDLTLSFPSFIREFIGTTNDGVTHLLDALKAVQLAQTNITGKIVKKIKIFFSLTGCLIMI